MRGRKLLALTLLLAFVANIALPAYAAENNPLPDLPVTSYVLMEQETGEILGSKDMHLELPIASVTKIMTMLLIMEAIDSGRITMDDVVTTSEYANSMGGSQIFLAVGEQMPVREMLKGIAVASGNDAAVAMAEFVAGSIGAFVDMMNKRAKELGMEHTSFKNATGLDEDGHYSCAVDVAIMSRELLKHEKIMEFTTIWRDSMRNGEFDLVNTNRLIYDYKNAKITGLKTGSTSKAMFCLSASAQKDGLELISVVLGSPTGEERFDSAAALLDYGFANFEFIDLIDANTILASTDVQKGESKTVDLVSASGFSKIMPKDSKDKLEQKVSYEKEIKAPIEKNAKLGTVQIFCDGEELASIDLVAAETVEHIKLWDVFGNLVKDWVSMKR